MFEFYSILVCFRENKTDVTYQTKIAGSFCGANQLIRLISFLKLDYAIIKYE